MLSFQSYPIIQHTGGAELYDTIIQFLVFRRSYDMLHPVFHRSYDMLHTGKTLQSIYFANECQAL